MKMKYSAKREILNSDDLAQIAWEAIEPIWDDLPLSSSYKKLTLFMASLTDGQKGLIALDWCQKEIRNGGIKHLFMSSTGNLVPWAIPGLKMIGAFEYANVLEEAISYFGTEYPNSGSARKKVLRKLTDYQKERLEELENEFFKLLWSKDKDLENFRENYVKKNPEQFICDQKLG